MSFICLKALFSFAAISLPSVAASFFSQPVEMSSDRLALLICAGLLAVACGVVFPLIYLLGRSRVKRLEHSCRALEDELKLAREAVSLNVSAVESLAIAIDAKDQTTHGHVRRTRVYASELGKLLSVSDAELEALKAGALLHDIGKLAVPDHILNKPGKLTPAEFERMKVHAEVGGQIISRVGFPYPVGEIVRHHHEKWDGTGYPDGLEGDSIPLVARIIAVVDFYDSTRCDRPYRAGMMREESLALLRSKAGKSFDPDVVEAFVRNVERFDGLISSDDLSEQVRRDSSDGVEHAGTVGCKTQVAAPLSDNAAGFRSIAEAQREVLALHEITQTIGSTLNLTDTVALVAGKLRSIVPFDTCVFFVVNEGAGKAESIYSFGASSEFFSERRVNVGEGVTGWVVANARSMFGAQPELDLAGVPFEVASQVRDVISSPLLREDGSFGAVTLYSARAATYTTEHARLLESVCLHTSGALSNAITHEKTKQSALTDTLTALPNSRALRLMLEQRVAECRRNGREPASVLSMDVDGFKEVNDAFGHGVGDRLLASVASVIKKQLREMDTLARYSGDEFVAVLPGATADAALMIAERIRSAVESHEFTVKTGRAIRVSVSVGVACYPDDGPAADDLLLAATQKMQRSKHVRRTPHGAASVIPIDSYR
ncbi:MAG TPA: diguanylate cyclase [Pyrinomonadaceae bacterium]|nr:diguanylate cyclase [Pyrinomonadaceae bacterium]